MGRYDDELADVTRSIWGMFFSEPLAPAPEESFDAASCVIGSVGIEGAWNGSLNLQCAQSLAASLTAEMLQAGEPSEAEICDAFGELANMTGGNVKALLPGPTTMSVPTVRFNAEDSPGESGSVGAVTLEYRGQPLRVLLVEADA